MKATHTFLVLFVLFWTTLVLYRLMNVTSFDNKACPPGQVCMTKTQFDKLLDRDSNPGGVGYDPKLTRPSLTEERDRKVLSDPLYPALNRSNRGVFEGVLESSIKRQMNVPTNTYNDSYRQIGYLTNEDDPVRSWKVMGKQTDRNRGSFYMIPTNKNYDMKIQLTDDIMAGERLRDIENIPSELTFKSPLLAQSPYVFSELPRGNFEDEIM